MGPFTNYVDKTREVGGAGNVNGMQMPSYIAVKKFHHQCQTGVGRLSKMGKISTT